MKKHLLVLTISLLFVVNHTFAQSACIEDHKRGMLTKYSELDPIEGIWMTSQCFVYKYINGQLAKKDVLTGSTTFDYLILLQPGQRFYMIKTDDCEFPTGFRGAAIFRPTPDPTLYVGNSPTQTFNVTRDGNKLTYKIREDYNKIRKEFGRQAANMIDIEFEFNLIKIWPTEKDYKEFLLKK